MPTLRQNAVVSVAKSNLKVSDILHEHAAHVDVPLIQAQRVLNRPIACPKICREPWPRKPLLGLRLRKPIPIDKGHGLLSKYDDAPATWKPAVARGLHNQYIHNSRPAVREPCPAAGSSHSHNLTDAERDRGSLRYGPGSRTASRCSRRCGAPRSASHGRGCRSWGIPTPACRRPPRS